MSAVCEEAGPIHPGRLQYSIDIKAIAEGVSKEFGISSDEGRASYGLTLKANAGEGRRKLPRYTFISGLGSDAQFRVHTNSLHNVLRGIVTRVLTVKYDERTIKHRVARDRLVVECGKNGKWPIGEEPSWKLRTVMATRAASELGYGIPFPPVAGAFRTEEFLRFYRGVVRGCRKATPVEVDEYHRNYRGRRATVYWRAGLTLDQWRVSVKDFKIKAFVKREKLNFTSKSDPDPRIIQPSDPRANVSLGRYIRSLEGPLMKSVARMWGGPTVTKGYNAFEVGEIIRKAWDEFQNPVAVGLDASRFDETVSVEAQRYEHMFYLALVPSYVRRDLERLLDHDVHKNGTAFTDDGTIKYRLPGSRGSGSMTTGMGNCLVMTSAVYSWVAKLGIRARLINNGDDCVVICERGDLSKLNTGLFEYFCDLGFTIESEEPVYELEHIKFCQASPVFDGCRWRMVRDPHTSLSKDAVCLMAGLTDTSYATWLDSVGRCGLALAGDMPVLGEYYQCFVRNAKNIATNTNRIDTNALFESGMARLAHGLTPHYGEPTSEARASFYEAFGIMPEAQIELENYYRKFIISSSEVVESWGSAPHFNSISPLGLLS